MRVEGLGDVEVVGDEVAEPVVVDGVLGGETFGGGNVGFGDGDVGAAMYWNKCQFFVIGVKRA